MIKSNRIFAPDILKDKSRTQGNIISVFILAGSAMPAQLSKCLGVNVAA